jgi:O-antigen/teichoic acid export membrane protein
MQHFRDIKNVTLSFVVNLGGAMVSSIWIFRILGPTIMGTWRTAMLLDPVAGLTRLGANRGASLEIPVLDSQHNTKESDRIASSAVTYHVLLGLGVGVAIFLLSFLPSDHKLQVALRWVALGEAILQPYYCMTDLACARHLFDLRYKETLLRCAVDLGAGIALAELFGLSGLGAGAAFPLVVGSLYIWMRVRRSFQIRPDFGRIRVLISKGAPYSITEAVFDFVRRLDTMFIALLLGPTFVGYYGISYLIMDSAKLVIQRGMSEVISPYMQREFGRSGSFANVTAFYELPIRIICYLVPPLIGICVLLLPPIVRVALPKYAPGIPAAQITIWGVFFLALHGSMSSFFVATRRIPAVLWLLVISGVSGAVGQYAVIRVGLGLRGAAWITVALLTLISSGEIAIARHACGCKLSGTLPFLASLYLPLVASFAVTTMIAHVSFGARVPVALGLGYRAALLLLLYAPILAAYENRFTMLRAIYQAI